MSEQDAVQAAREAVLEYVDDCCDGAHRRGADAALDVLVAAVRVEALRPLKAVMLDYHIKARQAHKVSQAVEDAAIFIEQAEAELTAARERLEAQHGARER